MSNRKRRTFENIFLVGVDPPRFLDTVIPHAYVGHYNEFDWWDILPGEQPPDHRGFTMEERGGHEVQVEVVTFGEPLTGWAERIAETFPDVFVMLKVDDVMVGTWRGGVRADP